MKEKVITIIIGVGFGLALAIGYLAYNQVKKPASPPTPPAVKEEPVVSGVANILLELDQPADRSSTTSATLILSGKTVSSATLFVLANMDEKIASADAAGNFETTVKLEDGENEISVTAFSNKISSNIVRRNVTLEIEAK